MRFGECHNLSAVSVAGEIRAAGTAREPLSRRSPRASRLATIGYVAVAPASRTPASASSRSYVPAPAVVNQQIDHSPDCKHRPRDERRQITHAEARGLILRQHSACEAHDHAAYRIPYTACSFAHPRHHTRGPERGVRLALRPIGNRSCLDDNNARSAS